MYVVHFMVLFGNLQATNSVILNGSIFLVKETTIRTTMPDDNLSWLTTRC